MFEASAFFSPVTSATATPKTESAGHRRSSGAGEKSIAVHVVKRAFPLKAGFHGCNERSDEDRNGPRALKVV